jgi:hypothetical protein
MDNIKADIVLCGAKENGLILIGDCFIGYRFVPRSDFAEKADELLFSCFDFDVEPEETNDWYESHKDGEYDGKLWDATKPEDK